MGPTSVQKWLDEHRQPTKTAHLEEDKTDIKETTNTNTKAISISMNMKA